MARPWRIVGLLGLSSSAYISMSRTAHVLFANWPCTFAIIAIIISGHCKGRRKSSTVWCAFHTPHARDCGRPSAPKPHCPSACRAGVWGGTCFAGLAIADLPAIGRSLPTFKGVWRSSAYFVQLGVTHTTSGQDPGHHRPSDDDPAAHRLGETPSCPPPTAPS